MNPEDIIKQNYDLERNQLQNEFNAQWQQIQSQVNILGQDRVQQELQKLHSKFQTQAYDVNNKYEQQLQKLRQVGQIAGQQNISNVQEVQFRELGLPSGLFPKETDTMAEYNKLKTYLGNLENRLSRYEQTKGGERIKDPFKWWFQETKTRPILYIKQGTGKDAVNVPANQQEQLEFMYLPQEIQRIREQMNMLIRQPNVTNRIRMAATKSNRSGIGTIASNMTEELESRQPISQPKQQLPDPLGLR